MKKILLGLLLFINSVLIAQTTINYTENTNIIANPERGMYYHTETHSDSYELLTQSSLVNLRNTDKITLILRVFYLENYKNTQIPDEYLNNMRTDFNRARNAGVKIIVRFAYTDSSSQSDASKPIVLQHIAQLSTVLNANSDVILCVQQGFIGAWGEGYYTSYFGSNGVLTAQNIADRNEVLQYELDKFNTIIQVRTPLFKQRFTGTNIPLNSSNAYNGSDSSRLGHHNDSFLSSNSEQGTYSGNNGNILIERAYVAQETQFTPMGGEANEFPTTFTDNVLSDMNTYNYTYFNSVGYASGIINDWNSNGWLTQIKNRLGYRFILDSSTFTKNGNLLSVSISLRNTGFARMFKSRTLYLVLKSSTDTLLEVLPTDMRTWDGNVTINHSFNVVDGNYEAFLWAPDDSLSDSAFAVQFANTGLWDSTTGYNKLNQVFEITSTCSQTATWTGVNWIGGVPSETINTIINGNFDTTLNGSFDCCNLTVNGNLIVNTADYVTVQNHIEVLGTLIVKNGGKLIPVNDTSTSNGLVSVERRTTNMKRYDYTYWSSPVNTTISQVLGGWQNNYTFEFITSNFSDIQTHINGVFQSNIPDGQDDAAPFAWTLVGQGDNMISGKGYASMIKSTPSTGVYPRSELVTFIGDLNTGVINYPLVMSSNGSTNNDDFNLVGNPYSSSIKANDFINENLPNISGTLAFWAHTGSLGSGSAYPGLLANNFSTSDYAYWNLLGGTASASNLGTPSGNGGTKVPTSAIGSGQGFLVEAENTNDLVFKPSFMDKVIDNTTALVFFRTTETQDKKLWVSLSTELGLFSQQLIGYEEGTTLNYEKGWDFIEKTPRQALTFYSIENELKYKIQARGDFDITDVVKLGFKSEVAETFTITVDSIVGIENVYIKDYGVTHNLPYTFTSEIGEYNDRFELVYQNSLSIIDLNINDFYVYPNSTSDFVNIVVKDLSKYTISLNNILGQKLDVTMIKEDILDMRHLSEGIYILEIKNQDVKQSFKIFKK